MRIRRRSRPPTAREIARHVQTLGPLDGSHVLVLRNCQPDFGDEIVQELVTLAVERGLLGMAADHVPLVVALHGDDSTIEALDEHEMNRHGWFRRSILAKPDARETHDRLSMPPGAYS